MTVRKSFNLRVHLLSIFCLHTNVVRVKWPLAARPFEPDLLYIGLSYLADLNYRFIPIGPFIYNVQSLLRMARFSLSLPL